ncbi:MAG: hypothetical protein NXI22_18120 [bacterium]|nr:hypothetical protein [bacterium]
MTLLDQFRSGDCERVWRQIVDESRSANDPEAVAVAQETVLRARDNLRTIYERLVELGYDFAEPDDAFVATTPEEAGDELAAIEAEYGALPGLMRIWYSHIRSVNFAQTEAQCNEPGHILRSLGWNPLAIYLSLGKCRELAETVHARYTEWHRTTMARDLDDFTRNYMNQCKTPEEMAGFFPLGSIASNNENKGFMLPCNLIDTTFYNDGELTHFNEDLRYVILAGCFPRLGSVFFREKAPEFMKFGHPDPDELLAFLSRDLQSI